MSKGIRYSDEARSRAIRMVQEHEGEYDTANLLEEIRTLLSTYGALPSREYRDTMRAVVAGELTAIMETIRWVRRSWHGRSVTDRQSDLQAALPASVDIHAADCIQCGVRLGHSVRTRSFYSRS